MLSPGDLALLTRVLPARPFDRYALIDDVAVLPSLGRPSIPVLVAAHDEGIRPLLPLPTGPLATRCTLVRDLAALAVTLLPLLRPASPPTAAQAIDLGYLLDLSLCRAARGLGRSGPYALLRAARDPVGGPEQRVWARPWWPNLPPLSTAMAIACVALSRGVTIAARRHIQTHSAAIPWRRACAIAAVAPTLQLPLLARGASIRAIRAAARGEVGE